MEHSQDKKDLQRGALVNFLGYGLKLANPLLLIIVARKYGADVLGDFLAMQALVLVLTRVLCMGLDKSVLWWVAKESESKELKGGRYTEIWNPILSSFNFLGLLSLLFTVALVFGAREYLEWRGESVALAVVFKVMILGLIPAVLTDVLLHSLMGKKMMGPQVFIKETLVPISMVSFAVLFFVFTSENTGLAWGYMIAQWLGLFVSVFYFLKYWGGEFKGMKLFRVLPDKRLLSYSLPLWIAEVGNSFLQRMDIFALTYFVKSGVVPIPGAVGIYGIVAQFANSVRSIRRSFDPIVLAIVSGISAEKNKARLQEGFNHASFLVSATQLPIFAFFFCFGDVLLLAYGNEFLQGAQAIWILSFFWIINGTLGLCGVVILGYGYSYFSLINVVFAMAVKAGLLYFLIPIWGLEGAAFSVGAAYTAQGLAQLFQMRWVTGSFNFKPKAFIPLIWGFVGSLAAVVTFLVLRNANTPEFFSVWYVDESLILIAFLGVYLTGMWKLYQKEKALKV